MFDFFATHYGVQLAFVDPVCQLRTCSYDYRPTREGKSKDGGGSQYGTYVHTQVGLDVNNEDRV